MRSSDLALTELRAWREIEGPRNPPFALCAPGILYVCPGAPLC